MKQNYRVDEVADILDISPRSVYRLIREGLLPAFKVRSSLRIPEKDLKKYINRQKLEFKRELYDLENALGRG